MKRLLAAGVGILMLVAGCNDIDEVRVGPIPTCSTTSRGTLLLVAQAIPTAQAIPCIGRLPDGWVYDAADIEVGEATLVFNNPGVGEVTIQLAAECEPTGTLTESPFPAAVATIDTAGATQRHFHVMPDACVTVESPPRLAAIEMTRQISYVSREELRRLSDLDI